MQKFKNVAACLSLFLILGSYDAYALVFNIVPTAPLPQSVPEGGSVYAYYTITNNTNRIRANNFVKYLPPNVMQITYSGTYDNTCDFNFDLNPAGQAGSSCVLQLKIDGPVLSADPDPRSHLFVCFPGGKTCAGTTSPLNVTQNTPSLAFYQQFITHLTGGFKASQGSAYLMTAEDCPQFLGIFHNCFSQNSTSPYIIAQPPVGQSYVDPFYAVPFNRSEASNNTNIFYRLSDNEALVTVISYPPTAAYFGYQSYIFTRDKTTYPGSVSSATVSPNPDRYQLFASIGNNLNNSIVEDQYGLPAWNGKTIMYITTSNEYLAKELLTQANSAGIDINSIFVEPIGAEVITGHSASADDLLTLIRYETPESANDAYNWTHQLQKHVSVYKVSNSSSASAMAVSRYDTNNYTNHSTNTNELELNAAHQQLVSLLQNYLQTHQSATTSMSAIASSIDNSDGIPTSGLVGLSCIYNGVNCAADNQDANNASIILTKLVANEVAFIVGVNHSATEINNARHVVLDIEDANQSKVVLSTGQSNTDIVGFESGFLTGSAQQIVQDLNLVIPANNTQLLENMANLYVVFISRNCNQSFIQAANRYCLNLMANNLIPETSAIKITERSYLVPGTTTGAIVDELLYPIVIAPTGDF